jgi:hypothetical protein
MDLYTYFRSIPTATPYHARTQASSEHDWNRVKPRHKVSCDRANGIDGNNVIAQFTRARAELTFACRSRLVLAEPPISTKHRHRQDEQDTQV